MAKRVVFYLGAADSRLLWRHLTIRQRAGVTGGTASLLTTPTVEVHESLVAAMTAYTAILTSDRPYEATLQDELTDGQLSPTYVVHFETNHDCFPGPKSLGDFMVQSVAEHSP